MRKRVSLLIALALVFSLILSSVAVAATQISNKLEAIVTVSEPETGTIDVNEDLSPVTGVGLWDIFSVSTTPAEGKGDTKVRGKVEIISEKKTGFTLKYLEQDPRNPNYGKFLPMNFNEENVAYFGPATGFHWQLVTDSIFMVTWEEEGDYTFKISIVEAKNDNELASTNVKVEVLNEAVVINLAHAYVDSFDSDGIPVQPGSYNSNELEINAETGEEFGYWVKAELVSDVTNVDGVRYAFEITKEDGQGSVIDINPDDLEMIYFEKKQDFDEMKLGVEEKDNMLVGVFGPAQGFTFHAQGDVYLFPYAEEAGIGGVESPVETPIKVKCYTAGTYKVKIYAVQLDAPEQIVLQQTQ
ncbi:MAG: hypothetical protein GX200_10040 [Firmicutes bacterium]|nr:hypothetical protein [Bacillota bacterium]